MKQYKTPEGCLKENGEHAWHETKENKVMGCLVNHNGGHCSWDDPVEECYHCHAKRVYKIIQVEERKWIDETEK